MLSSSERIRLGFNHVGDDAHRARWSRGWSHRASQGSTKKRRSGGDDHEEGGASGKRAARSNASYYAALIPENEWSFICVELARTFRGNFWDYYWSRGHDRPELTWFEFYCLTEVQRIDALREEVDDLHRAIQLATGVNAPKELEKNRWSLQSNLRNDPRVPTKSFTKDEMLKAANKMMEKFTADTTPWIVLK